MDELETPLTGQEPSPESRVSVLWLTVVLIGAIVVFFIGFVSALFLVEFHAGNRPKSAVVAASVSPPSNVLSPGRLKVQVSITRADVRPSRVWNKSFQAEAFLHNEDELGKCFLMFSDIEDKLAGPTAPKSTSFISMIEVPCSPQPSVKKVKP